MIVPALRFLALALLAFGHSKDEPLVATCALPRLNSRSPDAVDKFNTKFRRRAAVMIDGFMESEWPTMNWTFEDWQQELSNLTLPRRRVRSVAFGGALHAAEELQGNQLLNSSLRSQGDAWMVFSTSCKDAVVKRFRDLGAFKTPPLLAHVSRQPVVSIGVVDDGLAFHQHDEAWLALLHGSKQWYLRRPDDRPQFAHKRITENSLHFDSSIIRCRQHAGEVVYFPDHWWHATYNVVHGGDNLTVGVGGLGDIGDRKVSMIFEGDLSGLEAVLERDGSRFKQWIGAEGLTPGARSGHATIMDWLLDHGGKARQYDEEGKQPLHRAASEGHTSIAASLLEWSANINAKTRQGSDGMNKHTEGITSMHLAAAQGHTGMLSWLLEHRGDINANAAQGLQALHLAANSGHVDTVSWLKNHDNPLTRPRTPKASLAVSAAAAGHLAMLSLLHSDRTLVNDEKGEQKLSLEVALKFGHADVVKSLIDQGAVSSMQFEESMPVHWAARYGHVGVLEVLLHHGVHDVHMADAGKALPLHYSAGQGHKRVAKLLLQRRASLDAVDSDARGAIHHAAMNGHNSVLGLLLKRRANVNARDRHGIQPLHLAAQQNHIKCLSLLWRHGAERFETHLASQFGHAQVMAWLREKFEL